MSRNDARPGANRLQQEVIFTNRATAEPTCPVCDGSTRVKPIGHELRRICRAGCGWTGDVLVAETETAAAALIERGQGHLIGGFPSF